jgi:hypothetical protein
MPKPASNKKLLIAIVAVAVIIAGLIFLLLSPWSPLVSAAPTGPKLLVGKNRYVNACSVLDKALVTKQLDITGDVNKENASESFAYAPANNKDKELDLIKSTGAESIYSTCGLKLDRVQQGEGDKQKTSFINVSTSLEQFPNEATAKKAFNSDKERAKDIKTLPSFGDSSYYSTPQALYQGLPVLVQPKILYKNILISLSAPIGDNDSTGEKNAAKLDTVAKDIMSRINKHEGDKAKNFNGINKIGGHAFTDACRSVNYFKVAAAMGNGTELDIQNVSASQAYAPDNNGGKSPYQLTSACTFSFRTQTEINNAKGVKADALGTDLSYGDKFPHYLSLQTAVTENKDKAQEFLNSARKDAQGNAKKKTEEGDSASVEDVKIGDGAIKVVLKKKYTTQDGSSSSSSLGQLYYIAHGPNVYIIAATYIQQEKPFKSETKDLSVDQAKQIYKELTMASKRAN